MHLLVDSTLLMLKACYEEKNHEKFAQFKKVL